MKKEIVKLVLLLSAVLTSVSAFAGVAYPDPAGGWKYIFNGDKDVAGDDGSGYTSLDGTWSHDNGSDAWDGSKIGGALVAGAFGQGNAPGGAMSVTENGVTFLRIQDPGNPSQYSFPDPSNRKIFFGHDISADGASDTAMDDGVTLTFRARIPTAAKSTAPLDQIYADGQSAAGAKPYPDGGDGYEVSDGGKGNFVIKQNSGGAIAFAFTTVTDAFDGSPTSAKSKFSGLTLNDFAGNAVSGNVNFGNGALRGIAFDPTDWHELWVVIRKDPSGTGTHQAFLFLDGSKEPTIFSLTAGNGSDFNGVSYLAIGSTRTSESAAIDIDFFGFKPGIEFPPGSSLSKPYVGSLVGSPAGFQITLNDGIGATATKVNPSSVSVSFNGQSITPSVSKKDDVTSINYTSTTVFASGATNAVRVTFADTATPPASQTIDRTFTVPAYPTTRANTALDETKLDRTKKGFTLRPFGTEENNPNTMAWTEDALAGKHGDNTADLTGATAGVYIVPGVINLDISSGHGNFTDANGHPDSPFPGVPGTQARDGGTGNSIEEILTLLEFPSAGYYVMGVNSDDGFRVATAAPDPRPPTAALTLGQFDAGRGSADTIFGFAVESAGVYAFRTIWENGGGDANLEWFTVQSDGTKVLINDTAAGALKAFQFQVLPVKPSAAKPTISLAQSGAQLSITFTGALQSADSITGPWADVSNATSPLSVTPSGGQKFYRTKQ